mgnify:CR=1 FL=1
MSERIFCPKCRRDLGPAQPLPSAETKCLQGVGERRRKIRNTFKSWHDNQGVVSGAETGNAKNRY